MNHSLIKYFPKPLVNEKDFVFQLFDHDFMNKPHCGFLMWLVGPLPPHPRTVDLKVSEMSAFGPPRGCASGSLRVNINNN